jgi:hypothetical protein
MRVADLRLEMVLREGRLDSRNQIAAISFVVGMLQLTSAAFREVPARWFLVMRPRRKSSVVEQSISRDPERDVPPA